MTSSNMPCRVCRDYLPYNQEWRGDHGGYYNEDEPLTCPCEKAAAGEELRHYRCSCIIGIQWLQSPVVFYCVNIGVVIVTLGRVERFSHHWSGPGGVDAVWTSTVTCLIVALVIDYEQCCPRILED